MRASSGSAIGTSNTHSASITRAALPEVVVLLGGQPAGGLDDVVVERRPEDRDEDRPVLGLGALARVSTFSGTLIRFSSGLSSNVR